MRNSWRFSSRVGGLLVAGTMLLLGCTVQLNGAAGPTAAPLQSDQSAEAQSSSTYAPTHTATASPEPSATGTPSPTSTPLPTATPSPRPTETATATATPDPREPIVVGYSVSGRPIESYRIGQGPIHVVFVGGMHGGYEWNSILLAYQALDHFQNNPESVPPEVSLHIVPNANPDGLYTVTLKTGRFLPTDVFPDTFLGRFNANGVDLNRNWDCEWQPTAQWRDQPVYAGAQPFSEPESQALSQFLLELQPAVAVFLHSAAEGVYAAGCPETDARSYELAITYGIASGYPIYERFAYYEITGDAGDWLVTQGIPSITVELRNHQDLEWEQNLPGMLALLAEFQAPEEPGLVE